MPDDVEPGRVPDPETREATEDAAGSPTDPASAPPHNGLAAEPQFTHPTEWVSEFRRLYVEPKSRTETRQRAWRPGVLKGGGAKSHDDAPTSPRPPAPSTDHGPEEETSRRSPLRRSRRSGSVPTESGPAERATPADRTAPPPAPIHPPTPPAQSSTPSAPPADAPPSAPEQPARVERAADPVVEPPPVTRVEPPVPVDRPAERAADPVVEPPPVTRVEPQVPVDPPTEAREPSSGPAAARPDEPAAVEDDKASAHDDTASGDETAATAAAASTPSPITEATTAPTAQDDAADRDLRFLAQLAAAAGVGRDVDPDATTDEAAAADEPAAPTPTTGTEPSTRPDPVQSHQFSAARDHDMQLLRGVAAEQVDSSEQTDGQPEHSDTASGPVPGVTPVPVAQPSPRMVPPTVPGVAVPDPRATSMPVPPPRAPAVPTEAPQWVAPPAGSPPPPGPKPPAAGDARGQEWSPPTSRVPSIFDDVVPPVDHASWDAEPGSGPAARRRQRRPPPTDAPAPDAAAEAKDPELTARSRAELREQARREQAAKRTKRRLLVVVGVVLVLVLAAAWWVFRGGGPLSALPGLPGTGSDARAAIVAVAGHGAATLPGRGV